MRIKISIKRKMVRGEMFKKRVEEQKLLKR